MSTDVIEIDNSSDETISDDLNSTNSEIINIEDTTSKTYFEELVSNSYIEKKSDNSFVIPAGVEINGIVNKQDITVTVPDDFNWDTMTASNTSGYFVYTTAGKDASAYSNVYTNMNTDANENSVNNAIEIFQPYKSATNVSTDDAYKIVSSLINGSNKNNIVYYGGSDGGEVQAIAAANLVDSGIDVKTLVLASTSNDGLSYDSGEKTVSFKSSLQTLANNDTTLLFITNGEENPNEEELAIAEYYVEDCGGTAFGLSYQGTHYNKYHDLATVDFANAVTESVTFNPNDDTTKDKLDTVYTNIQGYYYYDTESKEFIYQEGWDNFVDRITGSSISTSSTHVSFSSSYIESNYSKTIELIENLNNNAENLNVEGCIPQIHSNIYTGELVGGVNDALINYETTNANLVNKLSTGLESISKIAYAINKLDALLASSGDTLNSDIFSVPEFSINDFLITSTYSNYTFQGTYENYINCNIVNGCDISSSDILNIRNEFKEMFSSDNSYLNSMISQIDSLISESSNVGSWWNVIVSSLSSYQNAINEKINFNDITFQNICFILDEMLSIINELGHDPITQNELDELIEAKNNLIENIRELNRYLYTYVTIENEDGTTSVESQINSTVQSNLIKSEEDLKEIEIEIEKYEEAFAKIKELEERLNEEFNNIQKYNEYLDSILPSIPVIELNDTGKSCVADYRSSNNIYGGNTIGGCDKTKINNSTQIQEQIIDIASNMEFKGKGLCAYWVNQVYTKFTGTTQWGNADDLYDMYCDTDIEDIQPGMTIAVKYPNGGYGHVGIYIGNGKVMSQDSQLNGEGGINIESVKEWVIRYDKNNNVKCGYPENVEELINNNA